MPTKFRPKYSNSGCGLTNDEQPVKSPAGKGLVNKTPSKDTTVPSVSDKDMVTHGLLSKLGDDLTENDFMDEVAEDGTIKKPQGVKVPGHAKPTDGFTKPQKHNHKNSIAESVASLMEDNSSTQMTMEEVFESYLENCNETASYDGFADHCKTCDYEKPGHDDTMGMMDQHQGYIFTPVGDGLYRMEPVPQEVGVGDLPGMSPGGPEAPMSPPVGGEIEIDVTGGAGPDAGYDDYSDDGPDIGGDVDGPDIGGSDVGGDVDGDGDSDGADVDLDSGLDDVGGGVDDESLEDEEAYESVDEEDEDTVQEDDIKSGAPQPAYDWNDGEGMEVSTSRGGAVSESSTTTSQLASIPATGTKIAKKRVKKAGNPKGAVKGMKEMGEPLKRKIKNNTKSGVNEGIKLPKSIAGNVMTIVEHVRKQTAKFPSGNKLTPSYRVAISLGSKKGYTNKTGILAEAAVDAEELAVIGKGNVTIEVMLSEGKEQKGMFTVDLPKLKDRKPAIVSEGMVFRFPSVAKRVAETIIGESVTHKVGNHQFGAIIKGDVEKMMAAYDVNIGK